MEQGAGAAGVCAGKPTGTHGEMLGEAPFPPFPFPKAGGHPADPLYPTITGVLVTAAGDVIKVGHSPSIPALGGGQLLPTALAPLGAQKRFQVPGQSPAASSILSGAEPGRCLAAQPEINAGMNVTQRHMEKGTGDGWPRDSCHTTTGTAPASSSPCQEGEPWPPGGSPARMPQSLHLLTAPCCSSWPGIINCLKGLFTSAENSGAHHV